ncbi:hypothetical protein PHLGIDRAFT_515504 [Phlebiopsis gigantea 11061_1 CR5-6]|uniref:Uncharacterized protein n=1 Tax=Phlebiopsis gigantea (strain 11061_1 CR5-6) TaxID=745531 RepID=A0A0C3S9Q6_PHLG1|nr:hypothetical protein PHLGIDRAFT_515504 [Phlebiopsis gigantea 11061_1 CR5-6]
MTGEASIGGYYGTYPSMLVNFSGVAGDLDEGVYKARREVDEGNEVPGVNEHTIPGIVVPQKVYTANVRRPQENMTRLTFFVNGAPGLRLQDALQTVPFALDYATSIPTIPEGGQRASLRILWPGYDSWNATNSLQFFGNAQDAPRRNMGDVARQVAKLVWDFWSLYEMRRAQGPESGWNLREIPFHQLYLIELRNETQGSWQPVIVRRID